MPGFVTNTKQIVQWIAHIYVTKINQPLKLFRLGKLGGEILAAIPNFANIKIANPVIGMTGRRKAP